MYKHTFCLSSAKCLFCSLVPIVKCAHCRHYDLACLSVAHNTNTRFRKCTEIAMNSMTENISDEEINTVIKNLKNNKAPGSDEITNEMIKRGGSDMIISLKNVYNKILKEKKCPRD